MPRSDMKSIGDFPWADLRGWLRVATDGYWEEPGVDGVRCYTKTEVLQQEMKILPLKIMLCQVPAQTCGMVAHGECGGENCHYSPAYWNASALKPCLFDLSKDPSGSIFSLTIGSNGCFCLEDWEHILALPLL